MNPEETQPRRSRDLPTFYYHAHFNEMLDFVGRYYAHVLGPAEQRFIDDFRALGFEAQCLYVRFVNRKGTIYARRKLRYPEIGDLAPVIDELASSGFLDPEFEADVDDILAFMTRAELLTALRNRLGGISGGRLKKADLARIARDSVSGRDLIDVLPPGSIVCQGRCDVVRFLCFLFFGRVQDGLSQFTMRDLGLVRSTHADSGYEARFQDADDARASFFFASRLAAVRKQPALARHLADRIDEWPGVSDGIAARERDGYAYALGRILEKQDETYSALRVFERGESARCSERVIRLLLSSGQKEEARAWLERCIENPVSDEEALLATDIFARKFGDKRTSSLTDLLRAADVVDLDEAWSGAPERAAAEYFRGRGAEAFRVENSLWRTLFGLLFWDLLFGRSSAGAHSPFDHLPAVLSENRLMQDYAADVEERLDIILKPALLRTELLKTSVKHFGKPNGVFRWRQRILDAMHRLLTTANPSAVRSVLRRFCEDYAGSRYGYPDLLVIDDDGPRFVEIKTEGDQLRRNQLLRIEQLRQAGFRAEVLRIRWTLDPLQDYVVVDVETTGGKGEQHRVTEIGAVKVRNGAVVDRFETLLNPQRSIPPGITRLTGITPAMVSDAPVFADIADQFADFLEGAIFVAHNVEFDYRFIGQEFRRLGRPFRMPKLCTVASMRRLYPGLRSYSLANLCETYQIPLKSHHRALCDAEAAAELLLLVNEKRAEALSHETNDGPVPAQAG